MSTPERSTSVMSLAAADRSPAAKPQRVLACVLCQQRKVKCDREFPCANCVKSHAQCIPAGTLVRRQRRRRFPERELLDRLRHYEGLLQRGNIKFEPLHKDISTTKRTSHDSQDDEQLGSTASADQASPSTTIRSETAYEAK